MDKLISAESLLLSVRDDPEIDGKHFARIKEHINHAPDAVKHGRWIVDAVEVDHPFLEFESVWRDVHQCSICKEYFDVSDARNYCPNCGARMDGDNDG